MARTSSPGATTPRDPARIYVPNSMSNTLEEIDPRTYRAIRTFPVGTVPQHVVASPDGSTLYVLNNEGNSLTPIDPRTGRPGAPIPVDDPYNLYFTPDRRSAIVVAEGLNRLDFRDPRTFRLIRSVPVPCSGVNHLGFSADGSYAVVSCEFSGQILRLDVRRKRIAAAVSLPSGSQPQDVLTAPGGRTFYSADQAAGGVWKIQGDPLRVTGLVPTGKGAHGLIPNADRTLAYVSNRREGSISLLDLVRGKVVGKWRMPGGGSPDMGGVTADGSVLWLSGRYDAEVYAISTKTGRLLHRIPVGLSPHGLLVVP